MGLRQNFINPPGSRKGLIEKRSSPNRHRNIEFLKLITVDAIEEAHGVLWAVYGPYNLKPITPAAIEKNATPSVGAFDPTLSSDLSRIQIAKRPVVRK